MDYESGEINWEEHEQYDEKVCLSFLKNIVEKYPEGKTVIILDYARIYHAKLIQPFLKENAERFIRSEQSNSPSDSFPQIVTSPYGLIGSPGTAPCHRAHEGNEGMVRKAAVSLITRTNSKGNYRRL